MTDPGLSLTFERFERDMTITLFHCLSGGRDYMETADGFLALVDGQVISAILPPETLALRHLQQVRAHQEETDR